MDQTDTHNTNQQSIQQQRTYPQRDQEENNQAIIIVRDNQKRDEVTSKDQHF